MSTRVWRLLAPRQSFRSGFLLFPCSLVPFPCQPPPPKIIPPASPKSFPSSLLSLFCVLPKFADNYTLLAHNGPMITTELPATIRRSARNHVYQLIIIASQKRKCIFYFLVGGCTFGKYISHLKLRVIAPISVHVYLKITVIFIVIIFHSPLSSNPYLPPEMCSGTSRVPKRPVTPS
jgi:hypothetical protein